MRGSRYGPAFRAASLAKISIPVEIVAGEADTNVPVASSAKYFAANIRGFFPAKFRARIQKNEVAYCARINH